MPIDLSRATLADLQRYVRAIESERGFDEQSVIEKCLLLGEEVGELFKAVRERCGIGIDPSSAHRNVADELADVLIFVVAISNRCDVDLANAIDRKEAVNRTRTWIQCERDGGKGL